MSLFLNFYVFLVFFINFFPLSTQEKHNFTFLVSGGYRPKEHTLVKYVVSLRLKDSHASFGTTHLCGGAIISDKIILTAAHCLWKSRTEAKKRKRIEIEVVAGTPNRLQRTSDTQIVNVRRIVMHPDYDVKHEANDIAVLVLQSSISEDGKHAQRINLSEAAAPVRMECTVVGWGNLFFNGPAAAVAMYADIYIVSDSTCKFLYPNFKDKAMFCAGDVLDMDKDACRGDSGGPLICDEKVYGVVSFGFPCGMLPGVYANVSYYRDWILSINGGSIIERSHVLKFYSIILIVRFVLS